MIRIRKLKISRRAQSAVEYLLLLGVATVIALMGFRFFLPKVNKSSERYFNTATNALLGPPPSLANEEITRKYP